MEMPINPEALQQLRGYNAQAIAAQKVLEAFVRGLMMGMELTGGWDLDLEAGVFKQEEVT